MLWDEFFFFFNSEAERRCLHPSDFQMLSLIGPPKERMSVYSELAPLLRSARLPRRWRLMSCGRNGFSWYALMTGVIYHPENVPARRRRTESSECGDEDLCGAENSWFKMFRETDTETCDGFRGEKNILLSSWQIPSVCLYLENNNK